MTEGWSATSIGSVCSVIPGQSPPGDAYNDRGDGLPFYQGKKEFTDRYLAAPSVWTTHVTKRATAGDILMSVRAPVGPINEAREEICIGRGLAAIRNGGGIDRDYLWYALSWLQPEIAGSDGAVFPSINKSQIEALEIPLPPLDEQRRIVGVLDQAFAALDRVHKNADAGFADAKELRDSIVSGFLEQAIDGESRRIRLGEMCSIARGGSPRPIQQFLTDDLDGVNWIKISDATASGMYIEETQQKISRDGISRSRYVIPGAFLLTNSMSFGRPYILKTDGCVHDGWLVLEPNYELVEQKYLYYLLGSKQVYTEFDRQAAGSTVRNLNIDLVSKVLVNLPPIDKQREAVASIEGALGSTEGLLRAYSSQAADNLALRQSLLQAAFSGQLT